MSKVRITIEQCFGEVLKYWQFNSHKYNLKIGNSPVGGMYMVAVLLTNIQTCLRGNQVSEYFDCTPPSLDVYLRQFV
jgi:nuclease HARBI1